MNHKFIKKIALAFLVALPCMTSCKDKYESILESKAMEKLSSEDLAIAMEKDPDFELFYTIVQSNAERIDEVSKAKFKDLTYGEALEFYKMVDDSAYWAAPNKQWKKKWEKEYSKPHAAREIYLKANISMSATSAYYWYTGIFSYGGKLYYNVTSGMPCEAYVSMRFRPRNYTSDNCTREEWIKLKKGEESHYVEVNYNYARWFDTMSERYGGCEMLYTVKKIKYEGKTYDVENALNTYAPDELEYLEQMKKDSLLNLNGRLYGLVYNSDIAAMYGGNPYEPQDF